MTESNTFETRIRAFLECSVCNARQLRSTVVHGRSLELKQRKPNLSRSRLPCNHVWCAYDINVCFLHNHNICFIYFETDPNSILKFTVQLQQHAQIMIGILSELHQQPENQNSDGLGHPPEIEGQPDLRQEENGANPGAMSLFSSTLLWLLGGVYSESFNSILSIFRDERVQEQFYAESPRQDNPAAQGAR